MENNLDLNFDTNHLDVSTTSYGFDGYDGYSNIKGATPDEKGACGRRPLITNSVKGKAWGRCVTDFHVRDNQSTDVSASLKKACGRKPILHNTSKGMKFASCEKNYNAKVLAKGFAEDLARQKVAQAAQAAADLASAKSAELAAKLAKDSAEALAKSEAEAQRVAEEKRLQEITQNTFSVPMQSSSNFPQPINPQQYPVDNYQQQNNLESTDSGNDYIEGESDKIFGLPKKTAMIGGAILALAVGYFIFRRNSTQV